MPSNSDSQSRPTPAEPREYPNHLGYPASVSTGDFAHEIKQIYFLILQKIWYVAAAILTGFILAIFYLATHPKMYQTTVTVQVERLDQSAIKQEFKDSLDLEQMNTIVQRFASRPLLATVLMQAGQISSNSINILALDQLAAKSAQPKPADVNQEDGAGMHSAVFSNSVLSPESAHRASSDITMINGFADRISVKLKRNTRLIQISVADRNPEMAARLANLMVDSYLKQDFEIKSTSSRSQSMFFRAEYERLAKQLQDSEQALQDYRQEIGLIDFTDLNSPLADQIKTCQQQLNEAQSETITLKVAYESSLKMGTNIDELLAYSRISSDSRVQSCLAAIAQKEVDLMSVKQIYREKHPKYISTVKTLNGLKNQLETTLFDIRSRIQKSYQLPYLNASNTVASMEGQLSKLQARSLVLSQKAIHYNLLARAVASDRAMFDAISQKLNEISVKSQVAPVNITVVDPACSPRSPSSPKVVQTLFAGPVGAFFLIVTLIIGMDKLKTSLRTVDEVEDYLQLPVVAALPLLDFPTDASSDKMVVLSAGVNSAEMELFRTLRAGILIMEHNFQPKCVLFTSSFPQEGKSFTSCNYASSLAQQGLKTLVMDLDLRKPRLEEFLTGSKQGKPGMSELLQGIFHALPEVVQAHTEIPNFYWLPAGARIDNPSELLAQGRLAEIVKQALQSYDRVIIDTPPLHPVKDALLMVPQADAVILLVDASKTARKAVARTVQWLKDSNATRVGVVLNKISRRRKDTGYYYDQYYGYGRGQ